MRLHGPAPGSEGEGSPPFNVPSLRPLLGRVGERGARDSRLASGRSTELWEEQPRGDAGRRRSIRIQRRPGRRPSRRAPVNSGGPGWRRTGGVAGTWRALPGLAAAAEQRQGDGRPPVAGSGEGVAGVGDGRTSRSMRAAGERVRRFGERGESGAHVDGGLRRQLGGPGGWEDRPGLSSPGRRAVERRRGCRALGRRRTRELHGPAGRPAGRAGPLLPGSQGRRGLSPAHRVCAERPGSRTRVACG